MSLSAARPGHGCKLRVTLDPVGAPGVYTTISEVTSNFDFPELTRGETEVTPHNRTMDYKVLDNYSKRGDYTIGLNWTDDATQDAEDGLFSLYWSKQIAGFHILFPDQAVSIANGWICSGQVKSFKVSAPIRTGVQTATVVVSISGDQWIDGVRYGDGA